MDVKVGLLRKLSAEELVLLNCDVGEDSKGLEKILKGCKGNQS